MDHSDLVEELAVIETLSPAERIAIARERRAYQLLKWREREKAAEVLSNSSVDGVIVRTLYERKVKVVFNPCITLLEATARNDLDEVRRLLASGADPNSHNEDGLTPLHQCAIDNNVEMLRLLVDHGADANARDTEMWTPLHAAACCGHPDVVKLLVESGALLLAVNADGNMPYDICEDEYTLDLIESEMADRGISQEDIDEERLQPERRMLDDLQTLHERDGNLELRDENGATPLHVACASGFYSCAQFLLECGCSTNVVDGDGWQPVHAAACWSQADILELLVAFGADINACTSSGERPLDLCEDEATRAAILTLQVEFQRRQFLSFARDSKRLSKRRKPSSKFESPQNVASPGGVDNHLLATRGAIRRLSVRDRSGVTLARLEARREAALMRRFSFEENKTAVPKEEATLVFAGESLEKRATSTNGFGSNNLDSHADEPSDESESRQLSTLTVQLSTSAASAIPADPHCRPTQLSSPSPAVATNGDRLDGDSTQQLSATEWLQKVRDEEQEHQTKTSSPKLGSISPARKQRRKPPAPIPPAPVATQTQEMNGRVVQHSRQHSNDSFADGDVQLQQRNASAGFHSPSSYQRTRTLVPGEPSFSRHPMTLTDLKKQRVEERKLSPLPPNNSDPASFGAMATSSATTSVSRDGAKARYSSPSGAVVGNSSPASSPKLSHRCCRII